LTADISAPAVTSGPAGTTNATGSSPTAASGLPTTDAASTPFCAARISSSSRGYTL
jgi:hypothetical protein